MNINSEINVFDKIKNIVDVSFKLIPFVVMYFLLLDYSVLINVFNLESGYFNIILSKSNINSFTFIYILIPFIFSAVFIFSGISSFQLSLRLKDIFFKESKNNTIIFLIGILLTSLILYMVFYRFIYFIDEIVEGKTFSTTLFVVIILCILLKSILGTFNLSLSSIMHQIIFELIVISMLLFIFFMNFYFSEEIKDSSFLIGIYIFHHMFSQIFYEKNLKEFNQNSKNNIAIKIIIYVCVFIVLFIYMEDKNTKEWKKPIEINNSKKAFLNTSYNLIFNRGFLINNKESINIEINNEYLKQLNIHSVSYIKEKSIINPDKIIYKLSDKSQYLQLSDNLKIYFQTINYENDKYITIVFIIKNENEKVKLIELSNYENDN